MEVILLEGVVCVILLVQYWCLVGMWTWAFFCIPSLLPRSIPFEIVLIVRRLCLGMKIVAWYINIYPNDIEKKKYRHIPVRNSIKWYEKSSLWYLGGGGVAIINTKNHVYLQPTLKPLYIQAFFVRPIYTCTISMIKIQLTICIHKTFYIHRSRQQLYTNILLNDNEPL